MKDQLTLAGTVLLGFCALLITGLVIRRELQFSGTIAIPPTVTVDLVSEQWNEAIDGGTWLGSRAASHVVVEFVDFQCSFCAQAAAVLDNLLEEYPGQLAVVYRHVPLEEQHPFAVEAATAAECASEQGAFREYHDVLFAQGERIGEEDWLSLGMLAGVDDPVGFQECLSSTAPLERIMSDVRLGTALGVSGTPTFLIEGRLYPGVRGLNVIDSLLQADREGVAASLGAF